MQPPLFFTFGQLEEFHYLSFEIVDEQNFFSFIERHPCIKKFVTILSRPTEEESIIEIILRIVQALPALKEIGLGCENFTHTSAAAIIERSEPLKRYRFWCDSMEPYHQGNRPNSLHKVPHVKWWFYTQ